MEAVQVDVAVVGGGAAGAVAARVLAASGRSVVVLDAADPQGTAAPPKFGEGLPPEAAPLVDRLGLTGLLERERFVARPCAGVAAWWATPDRPARNPFRGGRGGAGWILDRTAFERRLAAQAVDAGAVWLADTRLVAVEREQDGWRLGAGRPVAATVRARFAVDATGRRAVVARRMGAVRQRFDRLAAATARLPPAGQPAVEPGWIWVEAVENGWWYSACVPEGHLHVAFLTTAGDAPLAVVRRWDGFAMAMGSARATAARVAAMAGGHGAGAVQILDASTTRLDRVAGERWVAIGDAAATFDPLSSQGLFNALATGCFAARAVDAALAGHAGALDAYAVSVLASHENCLAQLPGQYAQAHPSSAPFWRRQAACRT